MNPPVVMANKYDFKEVHTAMEGYVEREILAGVSMALLSGGDLVDLHCAGWADRESRTALRADHIFRVFSNTKLVTSCAALLLYEEGHFQFDDPIDRFLPQLGERQVLREGAAQAADSEPAAGPITIRQLMTHSAGLAYGLFYPGTLMTSLYAAAGVNRPDSTLAEMVDRLAELPLHYHPGTSWEYSVATDVVARLVEVISGLDFDAFLRERIFAPLGMADTGFFVPEREQPRLAAMYSGADPAAPWKPGLDRLEDHPYRRAYLQPVARLSGGGGLVSTLPDMIALVRALMPGGNRLLRPETIKLIAANQLPDGMFVRLPLAGTVPGKGFGFAGAVTLAPLPKEPPQSVGELQWGGVAGTHWWVHPRHGLAGLVMTQREQGFWHPYFFELKRLAYRALLG